MNFYQFKKNLGILFELKNRVIRKIQKTTGISNSIPFNGLFVMNRRAEEAERKFLKKCRLLNSLIINPNVDCQIATYLSKEF